MVGHDNQRLVVTRLVFTYRVLFSEAMYSESTWQAIYLSSDFSNVFQKTLNIQRIAHFPTVPNGGGIVSWKRFWHSATIHNDLFPRWDEALLCKAMLH